MKKQVQFFKIKDIHERITQDTPPVILVRNINDKGITQGNPINIITIDKGLLLSQSSGLPDSYL